MALMLVLVIAAVDARATPFTGWGVKFGLASASQTIEPTTNDDISRRLGFAAGGFAQWFDWRGVSVVTGLDYVQKGSTVTLHLVTDATGRLIGDTDVTSLLHYLSVPVTVRLTSRNEGLKLYVAGGPRMDVYLGHGDTWFGVEDDFKSTVFGASFGVGLENAIGDSGFRFFGEFVYDYDVTSQYEVTSTITNTTFRSKNNSFSVTIGVAR